jgi:cellulose synthase/poly-beta-1,6-N-acetylglucosamine synthase-like glycosyltransferase
MSPNINLEVPELPGYFPTVSIVIPVYNGIRTIRYCLDAIMQVDYPRSRYEVIVVDNNSSDGTPEVVRQYPVRLAYETILQGPHAASNTGLRLAQGEIVVFTDSDCVPEKEWLRRIVAPFADPEVVAVGGQIEAFEPRTRVERFLGNEIRPFQNCVQLAEGFPKSLLTGNSAYRRSVVMDVGMFNQNLYTGSEVDMAWRVQWKTGQRVVYVNDAVVYHMFSSEIKRLFRHFMIYGYSEVLLATLYKDMPDYPRNSRAQIKIILSQMRALFTYLASILYRSITGPLRGKDGDYISAPILWMVAETGSIYGKLLCMCHTHYYRKQFWVEGPKVI